MTRPKKAPIAVPCLNEGHSHKLSHPKRKSKIGPKHLANQIWADHMRWRRQKAKNKVARLSRKANR